MQNCHLVFEAECSRVQYKSTKQERENLLCFRWEIVTEGVRLFGDLFKESSRQTEMSFSPTPYKVANPSKLRVLAVKADITGDLEALNAALSVATKELGPVRVHTIWIWTRI